MIIDNKNGLPHNDKLITTLEQFSKCPRDYKLISDFIENQYVQLKKTTKETVKDIEDNNSDKSDSKKKFESITNNINQYIKEIWKLDEVLELTPRQRIEPSFYEEISNLLFKDLAVLDKNNLSCKCNIQIPKGLYFDSHRKPIINTKKVDFCIYHNSSVKVFTAEKCQADIIIPIICVEAKTYMDGTMTGEILETSRGIKNLFPSSKKYVLCSQITLNKEKYYALKHNSPVDDIFVLRREKRTEKNRNNKSMLTDIENDTLYEYFSTIKQFLENTFNSPEKKLEDILPGRILIDPEHYEYMSMKTT